MTKINFLSFLYSLVCLLLFFGYFLMPTGYTVFGEHPLKVLLYGSCTGIILGVLGLSGVYDWKGMVRSIVTLVLTLVLSVFLLFVIFFGSLLSYQSF